MMERVVIMDAYFVNFLRRRTVEVRRGSVM